MSDGSGKKANIKFWSKVKSTQGATKMKRKPGDAAKAFLAKYKKNPGDPF